VTLRQLEKRVSAIEAALEAHDARTDWISDQVQDLKRLCAKYPRSVATRFNRLERQIERLREHIRPR
jgi:peptidoglycan hydrolase CwlO-like protein